MRRMILRLRFRRTLALSLLLMVAVVSSGQRRTQPDNVKPKRPRLVLLIVVDQFRYDYLERFGDLFVADGLRRLMRDGASWTQSNYDHFPTYTAPGHSTMMTGAYPAETGIVGNEWPYYVDCFIDQDSGLAQVSICRKDLADKEGRLTG